MSSDVANRVESLGKRYRLGQTVDLRRTFRETLMSVPGLPGRVTKARLAARARATEAGADPDTPPDTFWALPDIDIKVKAGVTVCNIGRKGGRKSTLLKVLSRITPPMRGRVEIRGGCRSSPRNCHLWFTLRRNGIGVLISYDTDDSCDLLEKRSTGSFGHHRRLPGRLLKTGEYTVNLGVWIFEKQSVQQLHEILSLSVAKQSGGSRLLGRGENRPGVISRILEWHLDAG